MLASCKRNRFCLSLFVFILLAPRTGLEPEEDLSAGMAFLAFLLSVPWDTREVEERQRVLPLSDGGFWFLFSQMSGDFLPVLTPMAMPSPPHLLPRAIEVCTPAFLLTNPR